MKVLLLAGGLGTRISEESHLRPKPMIEIGGKPILWHIMKIYAHHGLTEFVVMAGYRAYMIKEYFANYFLHNSDVTFDLRKNEMTVHNNFSEPWRVTIVDTGESTQTGGRMKRVKEHIGNEHFCMTYGDGVGDVNIRELVSFHKESGRLATLTAVQPPGRFGQLHFDGHQISDFIEKPEGDGGYINGGFFVLSPKVLDYIENDATIWEKTPLERLTREKQLGAFKHNGFWRPMDTLRDKTALEEMWLSGKAPWKVW